MGIFKKIKYQNGRRHIYFCNIKIFSYQSKKKQSVVIRNFDVTPLGKIYKPYYNPVSPLLPTEHDIYNSDGQKMRTFFIRDVHLACEPANESKYLIWDRFNFGLKTHFYSHNSMLETMGNPDKRYGFLIETEAIVPDDYNIFERNPGLYKDFDMIFTHSDRILSSVPNARFVPMCASLYGGTFAPVNQWKKKNRNVSILSSAKLMCDLHRYRFDLAQKCKENGWADTFGTFDGGSLVPIDDTLRDYRYSFCIENSITPYLFTERLICAFANQTVPIYLGASQIDKFFNPDGIIKITPGSDIEAVLKQCTPEEYLRRKDAILDNYERAKEYANPWDYMYTHYLQ